MKNFETEQGVLGENFLEVANEILNSKNFNDETKFWILNYIESFIILKNNRNDLKDIKIDEFALLGAITRNLSSSFVDKIPDMKFLNRLYYRLFSLGSFIMKEDGSSYINIQKKLFFIERLKCLKNGAKYLYESPKYAHIVRHELSHSANAELVKIENLETVKHLLAKRGECGNFSPSEILNNPNIAGNNNLVLYNSGLAVPVLDEMVLKTSLVELDEGVCEYEQVLIDKCLFGEKAKVPNDYELNVDTAKHIESVVGLKILLESRFEHDFNKLNSAYFSKTHKSLCEVAKKLNRLNELKYLSGGKFCYARAQFYDYLADIESKTAVDGLEF